MSSRITGMQCLYRFSCVAFPSIFTDAEVSELPPAECKLIVCSMFSTDYRRLGSIRDSSGRRKVAVFIVFYITFVAA